VADGGHAVKLTRAPSIAAGYHRLTVAGSDHVVGVEGGSDANDTKIVRSPGSDSPHQRFEFTPVAGGYTRLVIQGSGKDVVIDSASRDAGAKVIQYEYATGSDTNDEWLVEDAGEGRIRLANRFSGLYLTAGDVEGAPCEQRPYDGGDHQTFTIS
jgi:alpha-glucosidase